MSKKGKKKASSQNQAYKLENRHDRNKVRRMKKTLKNQPNNEELQKKIKEFGK